MGFEIKKHQKLEFYETFVKWCNQHKFPRISEEVLPENVFVCYNEDEIPVYCVWFYYTDSKLAWLAFPVSNNKIDYKKRKFGFDFLMIQIANYAKKKNIKMLFTTSSTESVVNSLDKAGFVQGDLNVNQYFLVLK